jgi:DNA repair exonuclease SbcCD ATPase subunit
VNYFNYFTEIEEHFQQARGSGFFLLSPLDWAMIETWKESGVPLDAVHKGIERAFEKWHARKRRTRLVNSIAYCAQEVLTAAREMEDPGSQANNKSAQPAFDAKELEAYFRRNAAEIRAARERSSGALETMYRETEESLLSLAEAAGRDELVDIEAVEQRLTVLEDRLTAAARQQLTVEQLVEARQEMERQLAPYRGKMTAGQLALFEKQYLDRKCLETCGLPRLSLFYM